MGLPSLTRGVGYRDDGQDPSLWTTSLGTGTLTGDGDVLTQTSATNTSFDVIRSIPSLLTNTYPFAIVRLWYPNDTNSSNSSVLVNYTDGNFTFVNHSGSLTFPGQPVTT